MRRLQRARSRIAEERGFTLIELLVGLVAGLIVISATFAILEVTTHQTNRIVSRVDATQQARTAMQRIETLLHSSCVGTPATPIEAGSNADSLKFVTATGSSPTLTPIEHTITFTPGGTGTNGTLTDTTSSGTTTLLANVGRNGAKAVFQYFSYGNPADAAGNLYVDSLGNPFLMILDGASTVPSGARINGVPAPPDTFPANSSALPTSDPTTGGLSIADARTAAEVLISFAAYPSRGKDVNASLSNIAAKVSDGVVLRLTPIANHAGGDVDTAPCV
jgi:prepilin-type N-terminal cleavage/methylation domain-containing protein